MREIIARYVVAAASLASGCWLVYKGDAKIGAGLIGFAGLLIDYAEIGTFALSAIAKWKGQA